jgi:hypothetical protein
MVRGNDEDRAASLASADSHQYALGNLVPRGVDPTHRIGQRWVTKSVIWVLHIGERALEMSYRSIAGLAGRLAKKVSVGAAGQQ